MFDCISPEWPWISSFDWYVWARRSQAMKSTAKIIQLMFNWFDIEVANLNVAQDLLISTVKSTITPMIDFLILRFSFSLCKQFLGSKMLRSLSICNHINWENHIDLKRMAKTSVQNVSCLHQKEIHTTSIFQCKHWRNGITERWCTHHIDV